MLYTWIWLDLRTGPLVLGVPPKVLGLIDDMWYHWFIDIGIAGTDGGKGGEYLLLPPGDFPREASRASGGWRTSYEPRPYRTSKYRSRKTECRGLTSWRSSSSAG